MIRVSTRQMGYNAATKTLTANSRVLGMWPDFFPHELAVVGKTNDERLFDRVCENTRPVNPARPWAGDLIVSAEYVERGGELRLIVTVG